MPTEFSQQRSLDYENGNGRKRPLLRRMGWFVALFLVGLAAVWFGSILSNRTYILIVQSKITTPATQTDAIAWRAAFSSDVSRIYPDDQVGDFPLMQNAQTFLREAVHAPGLGEVVFAQFRR